MRDPGKYNWAFDLHVPRVRPTIGWGLLFWMLGASVFWLSVGMWIHFR